MMMAMQWMAGVGRGIKRKDRKIRTGKRRKRTRRGARGGSTYSLLYSVAANVCHNWINSYVSEL